MSQSSRWTSIGREILFSARTELYMNLPFLDSALAALPAADGYDTPTLATDTRVLFFSGAWLAQQYERSRANVNRAYLHTLFHCLLRHPGKTRGRDADLWDLSCDIAVEACWIHWITAACRLKRCQFGGRISTVNCRTSCRS